MSNLVQQFCHNCGVKLNVGQKFCGQCGCSQASLSEKPPTEQAQAKQPIRNNAQFTPRQVRGGDDDYIDDENATCLADLGISSAIGAMDAEIKGFELVRGEKVQGLIQEGTKMVESVVGSAPKSKKKQAQYSDAAWQSLKPQNNRPGGVTDTQTALKIFQEESSPSRKPIEVGGE